MKGARELVNGSTRQNATFEDANLLPEDRCAEYARVTGEFHSIGQPNVFATERVCVETDTTRRFPKVITR